jgi:hypothetical protein
LDDRQDNLGQVSSFQASQPQRAAHREEELAAQSLPSIRSFRSADIFPGGRGAAGSPSGDDGLTARQAAARQKARQKNKHKTKITKGGAYDE